VFISHKTAFFIVTAVKTSSLTCKALYYTTFFYSVVPSSRPYILLGTPYNFIQTEKLAFTRIYIYIYIYRVVWIGLVWLMVGTSGDVLWMR
jgi:hypothetical protein